MVDYKELLESAIEKEMEIIGRSLALRLAEKTPGLKINIDISVEDFEGSGVEALDELTKNYQEASGKVAASIIARAIKDAGGEELELPERIKKRI